MPLKIVLGHRTLALALFSTVLINNRTNGIRKVVGTQPLEVAKDGRHQRPRAAVSRAGSAASEATRRVPNSPLAARERARASASEREE